MQQSLLRLVVFFLACGSRGTKGLSKPWFANFVDSRKGGKIGDTTDEIASHPVGQVTRVAVRSYHPVHSRPSSRLYTTRKESRPSITALVSGAADDYNHYRTIALRNTEDRALSLLTTDVGEFLKANNYPAEEGDLGENILIDKMKFTDFGPGRLFQFIPRNTADEEGTQSDPVIIEITEPIVACANLCKLSYINNPDVQPRERITRCQDFIDILNTQCGLRGWYAKVVQEGIIALDSEVTEIVAN